MSTKLSCEFCKKEYSTVYSLNNHKKTAKFCLDLQTKLNEVKVVDFNCEYCNKNFNNKKYLNQHLEHCKIKNKVDIPELQKENAELKLTIKFKDELIQKLESELKDFKNLAIRPTTVYNTNNTNNTNYQIEFNQLFQSIEVLDKDTLSTKLKSITTEDIDKYDPKHLEDSVSTSFSNILKDYTFCTDKSRRTLVIKKENNSVQKISVEQFINLCIKLGIQDIRQFLIVLEEHYDTKLTEYDITDEDFLFFDESLNKIKEFMNKEDIDISENGNPLKQLSSKVLLSCKHITK